MLHCLLGTFFGYCYGLFFVSRQRRVFFPRIDQRTKISRITAFVLSVLLRAALFGCAYYYLLITDKIRFILTMICIITGFWIGILNTKATPDGRL
jgi:fatty acid desaturase